MGRPGIASVPRLCPPDPWLNQSRYAAVLSWRSRVPGSGVTEVRAGAFPAVSGDENEFYGGFDNCRYCEYDRICSRRRDYELAGKIEDDGFLPWRRVGRTARGEDGA